MSLGTAVNTRIANELGAGYPRAARLAFRVTAVLGVTTQVGQSRALKQATTSTTINNHHNHRMLASMPSGCRRR